MLGIGYCGLEQKCVTKEDCELKLFLVIDGEDDIVCIYLKEENAQKAVERFNSSKYVSGGWKWRIEESETDD